MNTEAYVLESEEDTVVEVHTEFLAVVRTFLDAARRNPAEAREMLSRSPELGAPAVAKRAGELVEAYEEAARRGITGGSRKTLFEKRRSLPVYRDYLALAVCRKGAFDLTHDPNTRGQTLSDAFRVDESIAPVLDRVDRELFRACMSGGLGSQLLDDEEWGSGGNGV